MISVARISFSKYQMRFVTVLESDVVYDLEYWINIRFMYDKFFVGIYFYIEFN